MVLVISSDDDDDDSNDDNNPSIPQQLEQYLIHKKYMIDTNEVDTYNKITSERYAKLIWKDEKTNILNQPVDKIYEVTHEKDGNVVIYDEHMGHRYRVNEDELIMVWHGPPTTNCLTFLYNIYGNGEGQKMKN